MDILWTDFASRALLEIHKYYKEVAGDNIARKITSDILKATRQLKRYPHSGAIEETLNPLKENHRYLVKGNYKIVYKEVSGAILITDVFDTRQDPVKINDPDREADH